MNLCNIYEWTKGTLFTGIPLMQGIENNIVIDTILDKWGLYTPLVDDPEYYHNMIIRFFERNRTNFEKINAALMLEYDAIENYNRIETSTTNDTSTKDNKGTTENVEQVSAYDSNAFVNSNKNNQSDNFNENIQGTTNITSKIHGNIGVTTSQQMLESEINLRKKYNIYEIISDKFYNELLLHCL